VSYGKLITCHPHQKKNFSNKQKILKKYPSMSSKKLIAAVNQNNAYEVRKLLIKGTDPNARVEGMTALMYAAKQGFVEVAKLLILKGADVNAEFGKRGIIDRVRTNWN
jgi:hypothetical protein